MPSQSYTLNEHQLNQIISNAIELIREIRESGDQTLQKEELVNSIIKQVTKAIQLAAGSSNSEIPKDFIRDDPRFGKNLIRIIALIMKMDPKGEASEEQMELLVHHALKFLFKMRKEDMTPKDLENLKYLLTAWLVELNKHLHHKLSPRDITNKINLILDDDDPLSAFEELEAELEAEIEEEEEEEELFLLIQEQEKEAEELALKEANAAAANRPLTPMEIATSVAVNLDRAGLIITGIAAPLNETQKKMLQGLEENIKDAALSLMNRPSLTPPHQ